MTIMFWRFARHHIVFAQLILSSAAGMWSGAAQRRGLWVSAWTSQPRKSRYQLARAPAGIRRLAASRASSTLQPWRMSPSTLCCRGGGVQQNTIPGRGELLQRVDSSLLSTFSEGTDCPSSSSSIDPDFHSDRADSESHYSLAALNGNLPQATFGGIPYLRTDRTDQFRVLFVLGGPGAGKGTQSELLQEHYPILHLSAGELLRQEVKKVDSPHAALIESCLVAGQIVPVEISLQLLQNAMRQEKGSQLLFLVDGFPRNEDNLSGWCRLMKNVAMLWSVLVYQCPLDVLEARILERAKISGRSDDNLESVQKRFRTFEKDTVPVIDNLRQVSSQNKMPQWSVEDIRGDQDLEAVWQESQKILNELILHDVLTANAVLLEAVERQDVVAYQALCDDGWFKGQDVADVFRRQECPGEPVGNILNAQVDVITGKHVTVRYDRVFQLQSLRETRVWSHHGEKGWQNVHFARIPQCDDSANV